MGKRVFLHIHWDNLMNLLLVAMTHDSVGHAIKTVKAYVLRPDVQFSY